MELPSAGLHQLCASMLDLRVGLPDPERDALGTACGLAVGSALDLFLVGLAVLSLFSVESESGGTVERLDDMPVCGLNGWRAWRCHRWFARADDPR
jgi:hypothetical protein